MSVASKPVAVLHCAETIKGGIATYLLNLLPLQSATFVGRVVVLVPRSQSTDVSWPSCVVVETFDDSGGRILNSIRLAVKARRLASLLKPSVFHIHSTFAGLFVRLGLIGYSGSTRVVYCPHGWAWDRKSSRMVNYLVKSLELLLSSLATKIVCISDHEYRLALSAGFKGSKLVTVRNAVNLDPPLEMTVDGGTWPVDCLKILFVGRWDKQKGLDILLSAMAGLGNDFHAFIVGTPVLGNGEHYVFPPNTTCLGWLTASQIEFLLRRADVLVVPSRWEGFGLVAVEAMRAGCAVIASAVGGLPEIVEHNVTGILFDADSVSALVAVIRSADKPTLRLMGKRGRARAAELFDIERLHRELSAVYQIDGRVKTYSEFLH